MKQYKGLYIDHVYFHNKEDIDEFLKKKAITHFRMLHELFAYKPTIELGIACQEQADELHNKYGLSWEELEELENKIYEEYEEKTRY